MNDFSQIDESRLLVLLGEELDIFRQIGSLSIKQAEMLAADDMEAFEGSLERRQELIEKINGLHQDTDLLMQSYISFSDSAVGGVSDAIETTAGQLREAIADCVNTNDKNMVAAKEKAEEYIKRIGKLSLSRKSLGAYAQAVPNNSEFFDKKT